MFSAFFKIFYLDSRTLQVLLVKLEMTSCRISFRYLSTWNTSEQTNMLTLPLMTMVYYISVDIHLFVHARLCRFVHAQASSPTRVLSVTNASQMLVMAWRMLRFGSNW